MKKFAITHSTVGSIIDNLAAREASSAVNAAYTSLNSTAPTESCSACAKRRRTAAAANELINSLKVASDLELDRLKRALGVETFVFGVGLGFVER